MWNPTLSRQLSLRLGSAPRIAPTIERLTPLACLAYAAAGCLLLTPGFCLDDDSVYLVLARALGAGEGFRDVYLARPIAHHHFPPGLPAILALPSLIAPSVPSFVMLSKVVLVAFGAVGLAVVAKYAREEGYEPRAAAIAILLAATSASLLGQSLRVGAEMPYLFFSACALLLARRYQDARLTPPRALALAAPIALATATRSIGVTLLAAVVASRLLKRDPRGAAALLAISCVLLAPLWLVSGSTRAGGGDYAREFVGAYADGAVSGLTHRVSYNVWRLADDEIPRSIFPPITSAFVRDRATLDALARPVRVLSTLLVVWAFVRGCRRGLRAWHLYAAFYFALVLVWPWDPARYLVPLVPFLLLGLAEEVWRIRVTNTSHASALNDDVRGSFNRWKRAERAFSERRRLHCSRLSIAVAVCLCGNLVSAGRLIATVRSTGFSSPVNARLFADLQSSYAWVQTKTKPESVLACTPGAQPHLYLHTGRKTTPIPRHAKRLTRDGVAYLFVVKAEYGGDPLVRRENALASLLDETAGMLTPVYENASVAIYAVAPSSSASAMAASAERERPLARVMFAAALPRSVLAAARTLSSAARSSDWGVIVSVPRIPLAAPASLSVRAVSPRAAATHASPSIAAAIPTVSPLSRQRTSASR